MGRIRTKFIKRTAKRLVEKAGDKLSTDFESNKKEIEKLAEIRSKRLRNKIAGAVTSLMKKAD